jgi:hypothetical protein
MAERSIHTHAHDSLLNESGVPSCAFIISQDIALIDEPIFERRLAHSLVATQNEPLVCVLAARGGPRNVKYINKCIAIVWVPCYTCAAARFANMYWSDDLKSLSNPFFMIYVGVLKTATAGDTAGSVYFADHADSRFILGMRCIYNTISKA